MKLIQQLFPIVIICFFNSDVLMGDSQYTIKSHEVLLTEISAHSFSQTDICAKGGQNVYILFSDLSNEKIRLFSNQSGQWNSVNKTVAPLVRAGMHWVNHGLQLYTIENKPTSDKKRVSTEISVYNIKDTASGLENANAVLLIPPDKTFVREQMKSGEELILLNEETGHFLLLGDCTQSILDPIAVIGNVISGGHGGFAKWPFLAELKGGNDVAYYKWPDSLGTNDVISAIGIVIEGDNCHFVGRKGKAYLPSTEKIVYACFDLKDMKWSKPETVYSESGGDLSGQNILDISQVLVARNRLTLAWSFKSEVLFRSGILVSSRMNGKWTKATRLTSNIGKPRLVQNKEGNPCVFWLVDGEGIYVSVLCEEQWSAPRLIVEDEKAGSGIPWSIRTYEGIGHIIYFQKYMNSAGRHQMNAVYVCLEES